jgi:hypothetical protein
MNDVIQAQVAPLVTIAVGALVSAVFNELRKWLAAKVHNERLGTALMVGVDAVQTAVSEVEQTMAAAMREAAADGVITDAEKAALKAKAIELSKKQLGDHGMALLGKGLQMGEEQLTGWLGSRVEATVAQNKLPPFFMSPEMAAKVAAGQK